jgi:hypothetical protein
LTGRAGKHKAHPVNPETVEVLGESGVLQLPAGKDNLSSMMISAVGIVVNEANAGFGFRLILPIAVVLGPA